MLDSLTNLFVRTLRQDPADAELPSHKWLVRAGYIRRAAPGIYSWLPLGLRVLHKIEQIVRDEMNSIGGQEVSFPGLLPKEPYEASGRWTEYGPNLFRLQDRRETDMLLGPTHEEMFTLLVKDLYSSYKDLPLILYQIQIKYRDEARPRAGLLRGREFIMKDSYSFNVDDEGLAAAYQLHRDAYVRIFDRLGFKYQIVEADAGAMGGSKSEEFLAVSPNGEDTFALTDGGYAANIEAVTTPAPEPIDYSNTPAMVVHPTPDVPTIAALVALMNESHPRPDRAWEAADTLKNVVFKLTYPDGKTEPLIVALPGDRDVDTKRLAVAVAPALAEPFAPEDFEPYPDLCPGYIGPVLGEKRILGLDSATKIRYMTDPRIVPGTTWVTGANEPDAHVFNLVYGRDFTSDGTIEVAEVREGDPAPDGSGPLRLARGIEIGHIFQLGRKYAEALGLKVLDANGKQVTVTMGSYGVGVSRAVAAIAEDTCDERGLCWPVEVAPYHVQVVATGKTEDITETAASLAKELSDAGLEVLLDDRKASPGVKFADSEILGVPYSVIVGRALADGQVELRTRATGEKELVAVSEAVARIQATVTAALQR